MKIEEKKTKTTEELENELESVTDSTQLENWIDQNQDQKLDFAEYFNELCEKKGIKTSDLYIKNAVGKTFVYDMRNGVKLPSKKTAK